MAGGFVLVGGGRNGDWCIRICDPEDEGKAVGSTYLAVDEFILPSYDLTFDGVDGLCFPGDTVSVKGKVKNYSGHGFGGLRAAAIISINGRQVEEKPLGIGPDGSFDVAFKAGDENEDFVSYTVEVRLTDMTGETLEFNHHSYLTAAVSYETLLLNRDSGEFGMEPGDIYWKSSSRSGGILSEPAARIRCRVNVAGKAVEGVPVDYELKHEGRLVHEGRVMSGDTVELDMNSLASGLYEFVLKASSENLGGRKVNPSDGYRIMYLRKDDDTVPCEIDRMFRTSFEDGVISMQLGSGTGPVWAVAELFGEGREVLEKELVCLEGRAGKPGSLVTLEYPYSDDCSDQVLLSVYYFRNGKRYHFKENFERPGPEELLPLEFISFTDRALPGQDCILRLKTAPGAELAATVFDVSSEKIFRNIWQRQMVYDKELNIYPVSVCGCNGGYGSSVMTKGLYATVLDETVVVAYGTNARSLETGSAGMDGSVPDVREDFSTTLAFEPFVRPSSDGTAELKFRTSDKLSIFKVMAYAHDRMMNNALIDNELLVTLPAKVAVAAPLYLYEGDRYVLKASVSNISPAALAGKICFEMYDGKTYRDAEPVRVDSVDVNVPAGGSAEAGFEVEVPGDVDSLGFKVVFVGHECASEGGAANEALISDGMFVPVPVHLDEKVLTEAHSAVLLGGQSADEVIAGLRKKFVNVSSSGAEYSEVSVMDMIREALPAGYETDGNDAVSLSESIFMNFIAADLRKDDQAGVRKCVETAMNSISRLLACANNDGGFGWLEGMPSSPIVTSLVLERYAQLRDRRLLDVAQHVWGEDSLDGLDCAVLPAVKYLDSAYFADNERPAWYGRLSPGQYLAVRSKFAGIEFDEDAARNAVGGKGYKEFRKQVRNHLIPEETGTSGDILSKARMTRTIVDLLDGTPAGFRLRKAWGLSSASDVKKMIKSRDRELKSLKQYAVEHPSGGIYYPNAVMPWRGLLESEAYAHAMICDLFRDVADSYYGDRSLGGIADGISLWLMLQKETQEWTADPGYAEALAAVCDGSEEVRNTRIAMLKKRYSKRFDEIKASGNGFTISVDYYKDGTDGARIRLSDGDSLSVGDKITAVYSLWSAENRSHVRLSVPRAACMRPADQLSGWSRGWFRSIPYGFMTIQPFSYREVKADRTLYWIDVFPEEKTVVEEELFVTQEGLFTTPAAEIESLYAPHYRANGVSRRM